MTRSAVLRPAHGPRSEAAPVRTIKWLEQLRHGHVERACQPVDHVQRGCLLTVLQATQIGRGNVRPMGDFFLRQGIPQFAQSATERVPEVVHALIVAS